MELERVYRHISEQKKHEFQFHKCRSHTRRLCAILLRDSFAVLWKIHIDSWNSRFARSDNYNSPKIDFSIHKIITIDYMHMSICKSPQTLLISYFQVRDFTTSALRFSSLVQIGSERGENWKYHTRRLELIWHKAHDHQLWPKEEAVIQSNDQTCDADDHFGKLSRKNWQVFCGSSHRLADDWWWFNIYFWYFLRCSLSSVISS